MHGMWSSIQKPFLALAPMEDVTDVAFREMFARYSDGRVPRVLWSEFVSADGLTFGDTEAQERMRAKLSFTEAQRPVVAQIFSSVPERIERAAALVQELGWDGVDINMGCPDKAVEKQGAGAALIKNVDNARELIRAMRRGAPHIAVSVKTRIGYNTEDIDVWLRSILEEKPDALTVHLRTRKELSDVPAHWELMPKIVALRDEVSPQTVLIGNGDVTSVAEGLALIAAHGCDGVMVGRGAFGAPDFFGERSEEKSHKLALLREHLELFDTMLYQHGHKAYHVMKKHFKAYVHGWEGAKELRERLMHTTSPREAVGLLQGE